MQGAYLETQALAKAAVSLECSVWLPVLRSRRKAAHAWCAIPVYCHIRDRNAVYVVAPPVNPTCLAQSLQRMLDEREVRNQASLAARTGLTRSRIPLASIPETQEMGKVSRMAPSWSQNTEIRIQTSGNFPLLSSWGCTRLCGVANHDGHRIAEHECGRAFSVFRGSGVEGQANRVFAGR